MEALNKIHVVPWSSVVIDNGLDSVTYCNVYYEVIWVASLCQYEIIKFYLTFFNLPRPATAAATATTATA